MTRRTRGVLIALSVAAALAAAEVGLNLWRGSEACVEVVNLGAEPIEKLLIVQGASRSPAPDVPPGGRVKVYLAGNRTGPFTMTFSQKGNAMGSFALPSFNPAEASRGGYKTVLRVRSNEVERFQADADPATPLGALVRGLWRSLLESVGLEPDPPNGED